MSTLPPLEHLPAFRAVMESGSLSGAARQLGLSHPTVRRQIEALEEALGSQLFTRAANGLTPTELALTLLPRARAVLEEAAALKRLARNRRDLLRGTVRLTASRILCTHVLPQVLTGIREGAPDLLFELSATDQPEDLSRRAADIAIRFTEPRQLALVAQSLPDVEIGFFAAEGVVPPASLEALAAAPFISDDREDRLLGQMAAAGLPPFTNIVLRCDDPLAQIAHLQAGLGIGLCQVKLAQRLGLRRILPDLCYRMPAWLVMHEDQSRLAPVRHTFDRLKEALPPLM